MGLLQADSSFYLKHNEGGGNDRSITDVYLRERTATRIWRDADEYCEEQDPELRRQTNWRTLMH